MNLKIYQTKIQTKMILVQIIYKKTKMWELQRLKLKEI